MQDPSNNVLHNAQAMAILEEACVKLRALGLCCGVGPDSTFPESVMSAVLRVSTEETALDECIAASLLAGHYVMTERGRSDFNEVLAEFRADCAIGKAMNGDSGSPGVDDGPHP